MVGFFKRIFGGNAAGVSVFDLPSLLLAGDPIDRFGFEVVGESRWQPELRAIVEGAVADRGRYRHPITASLIPEPKNPVDPNAVAVYVGRSQVGYVPREAAEYLSEPIARLVAAGSLPVCRGVVVGDGSRELSLGVWLDLDDSILPSTPELEAQPGEDASYSGSRPWTGESTSPRSEVGHHNGRHYTTWVEDVKALKRNGAYAEASDLLLKLIEAVERESKSERFALAPWYYEQQAIVCRKLKDYDSEIAVIERYIELATSLDGSGPRVELVERLAKARHIRESKRGA